MRPRRFLPADPAPDLHPGLRGLRLSTSRLSSHLVACHVAAALALFFAARACWGFPGSERARRFAIFCRARLGGASSAKQRGRIHFRTGRSAGRRFGFSRSAWDCAAWAQRRAALELHPGGGRALLLSCLSKESGLIFPALLVGPLLLYKKLQPFAVRRSSCLCWSLISPTPAGGTFPPTAPGSAATAR